MSVTLADFRRPSSESVSLVSNGPPSKATQPCTGGEKGGTVGGAWSKAQRRWRASISRQRFRKKGRRPLAVALSLSLFS